MADEREKTPEEEETKIPVFTVLKNGAILKNIFIVNKPEPIEPVDSNADREVEETLTVGRHPDCNIVLTHPSISRFHLKIISKPSREELSLVDLASVHGTWVLDTKVEPHVRVELKEGDSLRIGASTRVYKLHWIPLSRAYDMDNPFVLPAELSEQDEKEEEDAIHEAENAVAGNWGEESDSLVVEAVQEEKCEVKESDSLVAEEERCEIIQEKNCLLVEDEDIHPLHLIHERLAYTSSLENSELFLNREIQLAYLTPTIHFPCHERENANPYSNEYEARTDNQQFDKESQTTPEFSTELVADTESHEYSIIAADLDSQTAPEYFIELINDGVNHECSMIVEEVKCHTSSELYTEPLPDRERLEYSMIVEEMDSHTSPEFFTELLAKTESQEHHTISKEVDCQTSPELYTEPVPEREAQEYFMIAEEVESQSLPDFSNELVAERERHEYSMITNEVGSQTSPEFTITCERDGQECCMIVKEVDSQTSPELTSELTHERDDQECSMIVEEMASQLSPEFYTEPSPKRESQECSMIVKEVDSQTSPEFFTEFVAERDRHEYYIITEEVDSQTSPEFSTEFLAERKSHEYPIIADSQTSPEFTSEVPHERADQECSMIVEEVDSQTSPEFFTELLAERDRHEYYIINEEVDSQTSPELSTEILGERKSQEYPIIADSRTSPEFTNEVPHERDDQECSMIVEEVDSQTSREFFTELVAERDRHEYYIITEEVDSQTSPEFSTEFLAERKSHEYPIIADSQTSPEFTSEVPHERADQECSMIVEEVDSQTSPEFFTELFAERDRHEYYIITEEVDSQTSPELSTEILGERKSQEYPIIADSRTSPELTNEVPHERDDQECSMIVEEVDSQTSPEFSTELVTERDRHENYMITEEVDSQISPEFFTETLTVRESENPIIGEKMDSHTSPEFASELTHERDYQECSTIVKEVNSQTSPVLYTEPLPERESQEYYTIADEVDSQSSPEFSTILGAERERHEYSMITEVVDNQTSLQFSTKILAERERQVHPIIAEEIYSSLEFTGELTHERDEQECSMIVEEVNSQPSPEFHTEPLPEKESLESFIVAEEVESQRSPEFSTELVVGRERHENSIITEEVDSQSPPEFFTEIFAERESLKCHTNELAHERDDKECSMIVKEVDRQIKLTNERDDQECSTTIAEDVDSQTPRERKSRAYSLIIEEVSAKEIEYQSKPQKVFLNPELKCLAYELNGEIQNQEPLFPLQLLIGSENEVDIAKDLKLISVDKTNSFDLFEEAEVQKRSEIESLYSAPLAGEFEESILDTTQNKETLTPLSHAVESMLSEMDNLTSSLKSAADNLRGKSVCVKVRTSTMKGENKVANDNSEVDLEKGDKVKTKACTKPLFADLEETEQEIFTPDKENLTPETLLLGRAKEMGEFEEIKHSTDRLVAFSLTKLKENMVLAVDDESQTQRIMPEERLVISRQEALCSVKVEENRIALSDIENQTHNRVLQKPKPATKSRNLQKKVTFSPTELQGNKIPLTDKENQTRVIHDQMIGIKTGILKMEKSKANPTGARDQLKLATTVEISQKEVPMKRRIERVLKKKNNKSSSNCVRESKKRWTMIVDITCLLDIESRKSLQLLQGVKGTHLVIPRTVMRELDCMKQRNNFFRRTTEVSSVLEWIEECLVKTKWWISIQSSVEGLRSILSSHPASPQFSGLTTMSKTPFSAAWNSMEPPLTTEDHVIDCAILYKKLNYDGQLVLLTDDLTLKIKAMAKGILCEPAKEFQGSLVNPFSERFLWAGSSPRGLTWSHMDDAILRERYHVDNINRNRFVSKRPSKGDKTVEGLKLILLHNSCYGHTSRVL